MLMYSVYDIANFFRATAADRDAGELLTHLKLQKLCYYAQGFNLAINGEPLFPQRIEAWQHGPVVPDLWHKYRGYAWAPIKPPDEFDADDYDPDTQQLLADVYAAYGQFSAWKLRDMTHEEQPWAEAWAKGPNSEITQQALREYFTTLVEESP